MGGKKHPRRVWQGGQPREWKKREDLEGYHQRSVSRVVPHIDVDVGLEEVRHLCDAVVPHSAEELRHHLVVCVRVLHRILDGGPRCEIRGGKCMRINTKAGSKTGGSIARHSLGQPSNHNTAVVRTGPLVLCPCRTDWCSRTIKVGKGRASSFSSHRERRSRASCEAAATTSHIAKPPITHPLRRGPSQGDQ